MRVMQAWRVYAINSAVCVYVCVFGGMSYSRPNCVPSSLHRPCTQIRHNRSGSGWRCGSEHRDVDGRRTRYDNGAQ
jgi:hypothetical protein